MAETINPLEKLRHQPMGAAQIVTIVLCTIINMVDGFDIMVAAFTGPAIAREWALRPSELGLLFSSGLAGMTIGALFLSPLADRWGRRRTVLLSLGLVTVGMLGSGAAYGLEPLIFARFITGAGVGAMMPTINTVVAEVASSRRRDLVVCLQGAGFPLGGTLGGIGVLLMVDVSWRWVYFGGGLISLLLVIPVLLWMPESLEFLLDRRPAQALTRVNNLLRRFGIPTLTSLPLRPVAEAKVAASRFSSALLTPASAMICTSFFLLMFTFYFLTNWTPKLLTDSGLSARVGISGAILINLGGVIGDLLFTALMLRWPARRIGPVFMFLCFVTIALFAYVPLHLAFVVPVALLLGFLLFGSMLSLYAIVPTIFPTRVRATGTGFALGLGRIGATVGPLVGGVLIGLEWSRPAFLLLMGAPLLACAVLTMMISARQARTPPHEPSNLHLIDAE